MRRIAARLCLLESHTLPAVGRPADKASDLGSGSVCGDQQASRCSDGAACCGTDAKASCEPSEENACCEKPASAASECYSSDGLRDACFGRPNMEIGKASSCCKNTTRSQAEDGKTDNCKISTYDAAEAAGDCSDKCCESAGKPDTILSSGACNSHLSAAFQRFEAFIRQGKCICRSVVEQLGFCCCTLSSNGQAATDRACTGHSGPRNGKQKTKEPTDLETAKVACDDGCCSGRKEREHDVPLKAASNDDCDDECCTETKQDKCKTPDQDRVCGSPSAACAVKAKTCGGKISEWQAATTTIERDMDSDVEHNAAHEQVVLSVSGMTCTGCSTKMRNVLDAMPGLYKPKVTFVSGTAAFELDSTVAKLDELLPLIEHRTGFKCSRIVEGHQHLDLQMTPQAAKQLEDSCHEGIVSIIKTKKNYYRITYNPLVVGARDLVPPGASLASTLR